MKILYLSSEARPFIASGGLADVAGSLPIALNTLGHDCRVVLPLYGDIKDEWREKMKFLCNFNVTLAWRNQYCGVYTANYNGVTFYFLDNEYYFKRNGLYGYYDDHERFAFYSKAAVELIKYIDFEVDVLHCNDWQSAMAPVYLNKFYRHDALYQPIRTMFTIHNIQYQGQYGLNISWDVLGIPDYQRSVLEYNGDVNMMKAAIQESNIVTTVSPSYAKEIHDPWFSHHLDHAINDKGDRVIGILNGIDTVSYDPSTDKDIFVHYNDISVEKKEDNKRALCTEMGLEYKNGRMLLGMVTRFVGHKGLDLVKYIFDEMMKDDISVVILGSGEREFEDFFKEVAKRYPNRVALKIGFIPALARKIYAGADAFLMPSKSEPCGLAQMVAARYGTLPIVRETGGLKDSIHDMGGEDGNGFTFQTYNAHDMLDAIQRAEKLYADPKAWTEAMQAAMTCDFSWDKSAKEYIAAYELIMQD